ncbi:MAG: hypothetical protein PHU82_02785 [Candidatus Pacebacteria bacterium]|jgi:hypothetical protein|nr:hypothetical protein [Candidatus Paceibacterota bacterium]MDD5535346.1 hypothetical protein [Candidatus Paceibacterota bacterium]
MNSKTKILIVILIIVIILVGCWWIWDLISKEKLQTSKSLIYPNSTLMIVEKRDNITFVEYESSDGNIRNFYKNKLQQLGWTKISDLTGEDFTLCGGDWGGTYKNEGMEFKLHICGQDTKGFQKSIFFYFYNIEPEQVLGADLSGGTINCITNSGIKLIDACYTNSTLMISIKTNNSEVSKFKVDIDAEKYRDTEEVNAIIDKLGMAEINIKYNIEEYGIIENIKITPIILKKGITYYCNSQSIESEVKSCGF